MADGRRPVRFFNHEIAQDGTCSTYDAILDHAIAIVRGEQYDGLDDAGKLGR